MRTFGEKVSISVGTALTIEKSLLVDPAPPIKHLWINFRTLFRNLYSAYGEDGINVPKEQLMDELVLEAHIIRELLYGIVDVIYYATDDEALPKMFPLALVKGPETKAQRIYANLERLAISAGLNDRSLGVQRYIQLIKGNGSKAWMLSHYPLNLMSRYEFSELALISSYSGEVWEPKDWTKKLSKNKDYHTLPFNLLTIQVIGDGAVQFFSQKPSMKNSLMHIATKGKWKPTTSRDKIVSDLMNNAEPETRGIFNKMLFTNLR